MATISLQYDSLFQMHYSITSSVASYMAEVLTPDMGPIT